MCGITGFWNSEAPSYEPGRAVEGMIEALRHRGPDDEGSWSDPASGVWLGHTRLAVIDLTSEGHQPMVSASGRYVMSYNGEIFNYKQLRSELSPFSWRGHSDTEVMLAAVDRWGIEESLQRFNGQFALAIWDVEERSLALARDRLGIKPLYVARQGRSVLFASELKAFWRHPDFRAEIDPEAVYRFLEVGYIPGPLSIFKGVSKLKPGHVLQLGDPVEAGSLRPYWSLPQVVRNRTVANVQDDDALGRLEDLLRDSVKKRMIADVPLGAFLSGGIDSSLIVALMQQVASGGVKTYSVGFEDAAFDEAPYAGEVAAHLGTDHTSLYVAPSRAIDLLHELPSIYDEPFADESQIPTALVSRLAREYVTVSLSGDGGDEFFGGYSRYDRTARQWARLNSIPMMGRRLAGALASPVAACERTSGGRRIAAAAMRLVNPSVSPGQVGRQFELLGAADPGAFYRQSVALDPRSLAGPKLSHGIGTGEDSMSGDWQGMSIREIMMLADAAAYLPDDILVKVDRASMDVALEVRVPLLDHRVVELSWDLPERMKFRDGETKWILRRLLAKYVPEKLFDRPKQGFAVPIHDWLRDPLRDWGEALLEPVSLRDAGLLDPAAVRELWGAHVAGRTNAKTMLWRVISLQAWLKRRNDYAGRPSVAGAAA